MRQSLLVFVIFLFNSCEDSVSDSYIRLNHFEGINTGFITTLCPFFQNQSDFGTDNWSSGCLEIRGFEYERGFIYELRVLKQYHDKYLADSYQFYYELKEVVSKVQANQDATFEYQLKIIQGDQPVNYLTGNLEDGYSILGRAEVVCENWCDELTDKIESEDRLTGTFEHAENGKIRLIGLRSE